MTPFLFAYLLIFYSKNNKLKGDEFMNTKLDFETIDMLSKGITRYAFRSGPVEEMHSKGKLTQKDMETLNKHMTNRIAGLLQTVFNGDVEKVEYQQNGRNVILQTFKDGEKINYFLLTDDGALSWKCVFHGYCDCFIDDVLDDDFSKFENACCIWGKSNDEILKENN